MSKRKTWAWMIALLLCACSKDDAASDVRAGAVARGSDVAIEAIEEAVRVWTQPSLPIDLVAARLEGVVMAKNPSHAIMHYDGYRILLTTSGNIVTRIEFQFDDTKPSILQLTELFGTPKEVKKGMLYTKVLQERIEVRILARTVSMPPTEATLVKSLLIEGGPLR